MCALNGGALRCFLCCVAGDMKSTKNGFITLTMPARGGTAFIEPVGKKKNKGPAGRSKSDSEELSSGIAPVMSLDVPAMPRKRRVSLVPVHTMDGYEFVQDGEKADSDSGDEASAEPRSPQAVMQQIAEEVNRSMAMLQSSKQGGAGHTTPDLPASPLTPPTPRDSYRDADHTYETTSPFAKFDSQTGVRACAATQDSMSRASGYEYNLRKKSMELLGVDGGPLCPEDITTDMETLIDQQIAEKEAWLAELKRKKALQDTQQPIERAYSEHSESSFHIGSQGAAPEPPPRQSVIVRRASTDPTDEGSRESSYEEPKTAGSMPKTLLREAVARVMQPNQQRDSSAPLFEDDEEVDAYQDGKGGRAGAAVRLPAYQYDPVRNDVEHTYDFATFERPDSTRQPARALSEGAQPGHHQQTMPPPVNFTSELRSKMPPGKKPKPLPGHFNAHGKKAKAPPPVPAKRFSSPATVRQPSPSFDSSDVRGEYDDSKRSIYDYAANTNAHTATQRAAPLPQSHSAGAKLPIEDLSLMKNLTLAGKPNKKKKAPPPTGPPPTHPPPASAPPPPNAPTQAQAQAPPQAHHADADPRSPATAVAAKWRYATDAKGRVYYVNIETRETSW